MLLSADIVFDSLPASFRARIAGERTPELHLRRPLLLERHARELASDQLYVLSVSQLPQAPRVGERVVLLVVGDSARLRWFEDRCCVMRTADDVDFFAAFNACQGIFDRFDAWERALSAALEGGGSVQAMLEASHPVFENELYVMDRSFRYLAHVGTGSPDATMRNSEPGLRLEDFGQFMDLHELSLYVDEPLLLNLLDTTTLNVNLLHDEEYLGCLTVQYGAGRPYRQSDKRLASMLGSYLTRAVARTGESSDDAEGSLAAALRDLVNQQPIGQRERLALEAAASRRLCCVRLRIERGTQQLPLSYVRLMVETALPRSVAFPYHRRSIVAFVDMGELERQGRATEAVEQGWLSSLERTLQPLIENIGLSCGVSDPIEDLSEAYFYFLQASKAIELGELQDPERSVRAFANYALYDMIGAAMHELPVERYYTPGFRRLVEHDAASTTSYVETLEAYLTNNMSATKTAQALYLHRSTLLERLRRMRALLGDELDRPDARLQLLMVLKALEVRRRITGAREA